MLELGIERRGTSFSSYRDADGSLVTEVKPPTRTVYVDQYGNEIDKPRSTRSSGSSARTRYYEVVEEEVVVRRPSSRSVTYEIEVERPARSGTRYVVY